MAKWVGASVFGGAACALYYFNTVHKVAIEPLKPRSFPSVAKFDMLAPMWDASVGFEETWMGYGLMRWWLLRYAKVRWLPELTRSR